MATHLKQNSKLHRAISVPGLTEDVIVTLTHEGLEVRTKGSRTALSHSWVGVISSLRTPVNVPSYLADRPMDLLRHQQQKSKKGS